MCAEVSIAATPSLMLRLYDESAESTIQLMQPMDSVSTAKTALLAAAVLLDGGIIIVSF